jgi:phenylpropionate dioxygenase-like ring-hydroxylating dioxygenase large terminal subunit
MNATNIIRQHPPAEPARQAAPPDSAFPALPSAWYFLCPSRALRRGPAGVEAAGRRLVVFRDEAGTAVALDAECAHMGADLSRGCVINGRLQCPFHGWEYAADGRCVRIPAQVDPEDVPRFARQRSYAVAERYGLVFGFLGGTPWYPLPELFGPTSTPLIAARPVRYAVDCSWSFFGSNGFDLQHFLLVHDRRLLDEPTIDSPAPHARRIRFRSEVVGKSAADRVIRGVIGGRAEVEITSWGGTLLAVTAHFRRATSRVLFAVNPLGPRRTRADLFALAERGPRWRSWLSPLNLWLRRRLTWTFIRGDLDRVVRPVYRPATMVEADRVMIDYFRWLADLYRTEPEAELGTELGTERRTEPHPEEDTP